MRGALIAILLCLLSAQSFAQVSVTNGAACSTGNTVFWDKPYVCGSSAVWRHPALQFGTNSASCTSGTTGTTGMLQWTGSDFQLCTGTNWTSILTPTITLGTSASVTNPQRSGQATTGFYTAGSSKVDVSASGTQVAEFSSTGLNLTGAGEYLTIDGTIAFFFPTGDTTAGGSVGVGTNLNAPTASAAYSDTGIGNQAMVSLTTGTANTGIGGNGAMLWLTTGSQNTMVGEYMGTFDTGSRNTGIGASGFAQIGSATDNTGIGKQSLGQMAGNGNTAVGAGSAAYGGGAHTGAYNTVLGYQVDESLDAGNYNTDLGEGNITEGSNNTIMTYGTEYVSVATGGPNLILGGGDGNDNTNWFDIGDTLMGGSGAPTLSSCGTSPTLNTTGSDIAGTVTTGTGATACTVTWQLTRSNAPDCIVTNRAGSVPAFSTSGAALTVTIGASATFDYICFGS